MGTQLIFTVGTNPLPIWVAWHHLKDKLDNPKGRLVYTRETEQEKNRLEKYCHDACFLKSIKTESGNPKAIRDSVEVISTEGAENLHVHYTGGTKVMAVETVAGIRDCLPNNVRLETSYLDPRGDSGPTIVTSVGKKLVPDTRMGIPACLERIANLNGFHLGPFQHEYFDKETKRDISVDRPAPKTLTDEEMTNGKKALSSFIEESDYCLLEYGAYGAIQSALSHISYGNQNRRNYQLFHNVCVRRSNAKDTKVRDFELDVVAVLGYQIVVVSCTLSSELDRIKQKGMEAILRARQLGGDEARAIVLCTIHPDVQPYIEAELHNETGSSDRPLQVWGKSKWKVLPKAFAQYLRKYLYWI